MSKQDFLTIKNDLMQLEAATIVRPRMLVGTLVQMCENLSIWAAGDIEKLQKAGLDIELLETLPARAGALSYIQSEWMAKKNTTSLTVTQWKTESEKGYKLNTLLAHNFRFAFANNADLLKRVAEFSKDKGHAAMIQNLFNYSILGDAKLPLLNKIGFDAKLLLEASDLSENLAKILAEYHAEKNTVKELLVARNRAYTYLIIAAKEISRVGKFVFFDNAERKKGYALSFK